MFFREKVSKQNGKAKGILSGKIESVKLWKSVSCILMIVLTCIFLQRAVNGYLLNQEQELIEYRRVESKLADKSACLLCGDDARSMIKYYQQFDTIGLISLNDWYMIDFSPQSDVGEASDNVVPDRGSSGRALSGSTSSGSASSGRALSGRELSGSTSSSSASSGSILSDSTSSGFASSQINTGLVHIFADTVPSGHRTAMQVTWEDDLALDTTLIEEHLCGDCLEKVLNSLTVSKRRYENKSPIPFCLVDFRTLELYSMQDWWTEHCIGNYWVDLRYFDDGVSIKAYC